MSRQATRKGGRGSQLSDYDILAQTLRTRYPNDLGITLKQFMEVESALAVAVAVGGQLVGARKVDRLLCNYSLLRPCSFGQQDHLLQMARRALFSLSSSSNWNRLLDLYCQDGLDGLRHYDVSDGTVQARESSYGGMKRPEIYLKHILEYQTEPSSIVVAKPGERYSFSFKTEAEQEGKPEPSLTRYVTLARNNTISVDESVCKPRARDVSEPITVTLDEMIEVAREVGTATGKEHYATILERIRDEGLLKSLKDDHGASCTEVDIRQVTSLVGLVGAGKSVFANILMVVLAQRGLRVVTLLNSVSDVMETVSFLRSSGVEASPLVSNRNRLAHLNEIFDHGGTMLLEEDIARYLETPCIVDGLSVGEPEACSYADVPCQSLRSSRGNRYVCPYRNVCPSQTMVREATKSSVVVTTASGFSTMRIGLAREQFFEHVLHNVDLVIFDEADRIQASLDDSFAPKLSFQEFIHRLADFSAEAMKRPPSQKTVDLNVERYYDLQAGADAVAKSLLFAVKKEAISKWRIVRQEAFTSLSLLDDLRERQNLPAAIADDAEKRIRGQDGGFLLGIAVSVSCQSVDGEVFRSALDKYLESKCISLDASVRERFSFVLKVIRFDEYIRELAEAYDFLALRDEPVSRLYDFLRFSHVQQQRYLPSSLMGNMLGMSMADDGDLTLFRQFAFGRAFMGSLPWLETDRDGKPIGPNALLLSGSSYLPGCLQYHVNKPVSYLLEAEKWKTEKVRNSQVIDLGLEQRVSGSDRSQRSKNLGVVLAGLASTLAEELDRSGGGKALVIVNSYDEAKDARQKLEGILRKNGCSDKVCAMTRKREASQEKYVQRSDVYRFVRHPARVLVAPALAIERGYNIVDEAGHAAFGSVFFAARPMAVPNDLGLRYRRMNGVVESCVGQCPESLVLFANAMKVEAWKTWRTLERDEHAGPSVWRAAGMKTILKDVVSTQLETLIQVFGRLLRLRDPDRPAPRLYFADAAFRGAKDEWTASFRTLDELASYLKWVIEDSTQPEVAQALYGPFYEALKKGIR